jgi:arsenite-transporting ATPase
MCLLASVVLQYSILWLQVEVVHSFSVLTQTTSTLKVSERKSGVFTPRINKHFSLNELNGNNHKKWSSPSLLFSLRPLVEEIVSSTVPSSSSTSTRGRQKSIFVGGKGGVGKTTVSAALAIELASKQDLKVLIVSTDPAHSLGDALDEDLRRGRGRPVMMTDPLTRGNLYAAELSAEEALNDFQTSLAGFDVDRLAQSLGVPSDLLDGLGLREFSGLLNNPPPGLDELVALSNVMNENEAGDYDVVIIDTAPTGHTLRLLALPQFLDGLLGKLIKLRMKLSGIANTLQAFLGDSGAQQRAQTIDTAMDRLDQFRTRISRIEARLRDHSRTNFLVVTIPTKLAVEESKRLVAELTHQGIAVNNIVVNQCVGDVNENSANEGLANYYQRRRDGQTLWIGKLKDAAADVSRSEEYRSNGNPAPITVTEIPFFDVELVGVPAMGYVGYHSLVNNPNFGHLMEGDNTRGGPKVVICGGKGGVGKSKLGEKKLGRSSVAGVLLIFNSLTFALDIRPIRSYYEFFSGGWHGGKRSQGCID